MIIPGLIFFLALIQSLFGIGILLFGTPTLLALGYEYHETLRYLIPSSLAISLSQVWLYRREELSTGFRREFLFICLPALVTGWWLTSRFELKLLIKFIVIFMLVVSLSLRLSGLSLTFSQSLKRFRFISFMVIGLIHGVSNMGGAILAPLISGLFTEKKQVLTGISFCYALMGGVQAFILFALNSNDLDLKYFIPVPFALISRWLIGANLVEKVSEKRYQAALSLFIVLNLCLLIYSMF